MEGEIRALKGDIRTLREELEIGLAYTSVVAIDSAGLHNLSVALSLGENVPHGVDVLKRMLKLVKLTRWPVGLKTKSADLRKILTELVNSLNTHEEEKVKELAPKMHAAYHNLCNSFYDWLSKRRIGNRTTPSPRT